MSDRARERWAIDELERVMGADTIATYRADRRGGEWDPLRALPPRIRRRLTGARYLTAGGLRPDVAADIITARVADVDGVDDAIAWYVRTASAALAQRRALNHHNRHLRVARSRGHVTYYANRTAMAHDLGWRSVWEMRVGRGWTGRPADVRRVA